MIYDRTWLNNRRLGFLPAKHKAIPLFDHMFLISDLTDEQLKI